MLRAALPRLFVLGLLGPLLAACQFSPPQYSPAMRTHTIAYNQAVARSTNELLFLNIIRASEREPRYFTRVGNNQLNAEITPSLEVDVPFNPLGQVTPKLTASAKSGNSLNIENLDDRKYQQGANAPIDASTIDYYWRQGFQGDLLGLLLFATIEIPDAELPIIAAAADARCRDPAYASLRRYCMIDRQSVADVRAGCFRSTPRAAHGGVDYVTFTNDPAPNNPLEHETLSPSEREKCFVAVLRTLLSLGLHPIDHTSTTVVAADIPSRVANDPKFVEEMIKQELKITRIKPGHYKVTKETKKTVFALDAKVVACNISGPILQGQADTAFAASFSDVEKKLLKESRKTCPVDKKADVEVSLAEMHIALDIRSFEALVYFLGEVVRGEVESPPVPPAVLPVATRREWLDPMATYEAPLFIVKKDRPGSEHARLMLTDDHGAAYWVPDLCTDWNAPTPTTDGDMRRCSTEYPEHQTMTVMTLVNQLWSLQKEPSQNPVVTIPAGG